MLCLIPYFEECGSHHRFEHREGISGGIFEPLYRKPLLRRRSLAKEITMREFGSESFGVSARRFTRSSLDLRPVTMRDDVQDHRISAHANSGNYVGGRALTERCCRATLSS